MHLFEDLYFVLWLSTFGILCVIDVLLYRDAPYPERTKWYYKLPGGGIVAYFKLKNKGRHEQKGD